MIAAHHQCPMSIIFYFDLALPNGIRCWPWVQNKNISKLFRQAAPPFIASTSQRAAFPNPYNLGRIYVFFLPALPVALCRFVCATLCGYLTE